MNRNENCNRMKEGERTIGAKEKANKCDKKNKKIQKLN